MYTTSSSLILDDEAGGPQFWPPEAPKHAEATFARCFIATLSAMLDYSISSISSPVNHASKPSRNGVAFSGRYPSSSSRSSP